MNGHYVNLEIEGDFIDSFIYSGSLFLVTTDSKIMLYDWERLLDQSEFPKQCIDFLKHFQNNENNENNALLERLSIDESQLRRCKLQTIDLDGWTVDINLYSDTLYYADENGVKKIRFNYENKRLDDFSEEIFNKYAYKISPNRYQRIAIAAGHNGVIGVSQNGRYQCPSISILEKDSIDCEWVNDTLVANSDEGVYVSTFFKLRDRNKDEDKINYYQELNSNKMKIVEQHSLDDSAKYAWVAGDKLFSLTNKNEIIIKKLDSTKVEEIEHKTFNISQDILSARTGLFGTVIEAGDDLYLFNQKGLEKLSYRPVNWRVFPRAKNYINHLHIIENDKLVIRAYLKQDIDKKFGIDIDQVS